MLGTKQRWMQKFERSMSWPAGACATCGENLNFAQKKTPDWCIPLFPQKIFVMNFCRVSNHWHYRHIQGTDLFLIWTTTYRACNILINTYTLIIIFLSLYWTTLSFSNTNKPHYCARSETWLLFTIYQSTLENNANLSPFIITEIFFNFTY